MWKTAATAASHVGTYAIHVSGADAANYTFTYVPGVLTIDPAPLTITANSDFKIYGAALPDLTASYSGFVNGDTTAALSSPPILSTTATAASDVGSYQITASGAAADDYAINYLPGALTISPAPLTITADDKSMRRIRPFVTPTGLTKFQGYFGADMGLEYPGPVPFTPVGVRETGGAAEVPMCMWTFGFTVDPETKQPTERRKIEAGKFLMVKQAGKWRIDDMVYAGHSCEKTVVKGRAF